MEKWNKIYLYQGENKTVTEYYFRLILEGVKENETCVIPCFCLKDFLKLDRNAICIVGEAKHLFALYVLGFRKFIFWAQGVVGAESYMRHHSIIRFKILSWLERFALKSSKICLCVSNTQRKYYEKNYHLSLHSKCLVMPCFNTKLYKQSFFIPNKYKNNVFCYIGSLAVWQCFEETVAFYARIEMMSQNKCMLKIYTKEIEKAKEIVESYHVQNYWIDYVPHEELNHALADCKFGFLLRKDNIVNNVATPTKMSTYLANGIMPIFSECIKDFSGLVDRYKYLISLSGQEDVYKVLELMEQDIQSEQVYREYNKVYDEYYNEDIYISQLRRIKNLL